MTHVLSLAFVSYGLWLLLSGHYAALLLGLGLISVGLVVFIAVRMDVVDREGHPIHLGPRAFLYWPWLAWEIVKANIDVTWRILHPRMPIRPSMIRVKAHQKSELGKVIYANSITLTPGTISTDVTGDVIEVHALTQEAADGLRSGDMDRRCADFEGDR
ncbi:MAG: Na+/H+ antiporter subunit E [Acidiferrobacterales bacterium]